MYPGDSQNLNQAWIPSFGVSFSRRIWFGPYLG